jgi:hypothetical protein
MLKNQSLMRAILFSIICMTLTAAASQTARATNMRQLRQAFMGGGLGFSFAGGVRGLATPETILTIDQLTDSGSFTGKYYPFTGLAPSTNNATGTITILGGTAIRITFRVTTNSVGIPSSVQTFDGALRLGSADPHDLFLAGTYTINRTGPGSATPGPYPFCATYASIP